MTTWHENDAFWDRIAPVVFTKERWEAASADVDRVLSLMSPSPGEAILDLGCGPGRHSLEFARRGYHVTGADRTAAYLESAQERARQYGLEVEFVHADMREFRRDDAFDLAVSLLTSFGYFDDPADDRRVLDNVLASLRPGGRLVIDIMGKEVLARIFRARDWQEQPDGTILLEERKVSADWSWLDMRWIVLTGRERTEHRFRLRLLGAAELKAMVAEAGFCDVQAFGSLAGTPYDHAAERLVVVARKPDR